MYMCVDGQVGQAFQRQMLEHWSYSCSQMFMFVFCFLLSLITQKRNTDYLLVEKQSEQQSFYSLS